MTFGPLCEIFNVFIYVSISKLISCRKCCVDLLCIFVVVSVFCTVCRVILHFPVFCHDHQEVVKILRFLLQVVLENQNGKICFCDSSQNECVSVTHMKFRGNPGNFMGLSYIGQSDLHITYGLLHVWYIPGVQQV